MAQIAQERIVVPAPSGHGFTLLAIPGDEIPDDVAAVHGIIEGRLPTASTKKVAPSQVEDKAVKPASKKTTPSKE